MIDIYAVKKSLEELAGKETLPEGSSGKIDPYKDIPIDTGKDIGYRFSASDSEGRTLFAYVGVNEARGTVSVRGSLGLEQALFSREDINRIAMKYGLNANYGLDYQFYIDVPLDHLHGAVRAVLNAERDIVLDTERKWKECKEELGIP